MEHSLYQAKIIVVVKFMKVSLRYLVRASVLVLLVLGIMGLEGCDWTERSVQLGVTKVTLWQGVNPPSNRDVLQKLVEQFNREHSEIQVESLYVGQPDQQIPKILAAVVGNAPPDLLWFNPTITGQLVELDAIRPLEDWLAHSTVPMREVDATLFESMKYQDHTWSVPFGTNNVGVFYHPSLFEAAGITELPKTWDELRQVARKLTRDLNGDKQIDQHGILLPLGKGEFTVFLWLPFMWSGGGELVVAAPGKGTQSNTPSYNVVNPGAIAALQLWRDLIADGSAILSLPERGYEIDSFVKGKVAMQLTGPWTLGQLQATGVDFGVFPIPVDLRKSTVVGGENLFIFKTTPERERAAFTFAEYVLSQQFQTEWALKTGYLPVNMQARQSSEYQAFMAKQPAVEVFLKQAQYGRSRPIFPGYSRLSENIGRAIEAVLLGKSSPQEALQEAQQRLDLIFQ